MKFFNFGEKKEEYTREKFDEAKLVAKNELKTAMAPNESSAQESNKTNEDGHISNRWVKLQAANAKLAELYNQGRNEAHKYNELMDEANKAAESVVEFEKNEFGMSESKIVELEVMSEVALNFLSELRKNDSSKADELTEKYEELRTKADETIKNLLKYEKEIGIGREENDVVEV